MQPSADIELRWGTEQVSAAEGSVQKVVEIRAAGGIIVQQGSNIH